MAGYRESFGANVDYAYGRGVTDMTARLQQGVSRFGAMGAGMSQFSGQVKRARESLKDMKADMAAMQAQQAQTTAGSAQWLRLQAAIEKTEKATKRLRKEMSQVAFQGLERGVAKLAQGLIGLNASILGIGFNFLIDSIKRVYELQERWTQAIGGFNMKIGGMTAGLKGAQRAAVQWSSTVRGLTNGDINEGIQMFGEFTMAIGRTVKAGDGLSKLGLQLARGFNIGGGGAGQMLKVFENIGMTVDDANEAMKEAIVAANAAGIPTNMLADDLAKSTSYMARFGKESQKTLIQGAAWARKFDISLQELKQSVEGFDMFDEAARTASTLNTAFGTMINSMDMMMEDDPAKRLEMIRQQFLAQGTTFDRLSPKQVRYLTETMKLTEEQIAALFNAGESYEDFQKKADDAAKREVSAKKLMDKQLRATAQTMYAFGAAFDRITVAIANAIKPLLEVFGLAGKGGKEFKSFGQVMESITKTVEHFFNSLAKNDKWNAFMRTLATDLKKAAGALKDFVFDGGAAKLVGRMADQMKRFYVWVRDLGMSAAKFLDPVVNAFFFLSKHLNVIVALWGGLKLANMVGLDKLGAGLGAVGGAGGKLGGAARLTSVAGGAAAGGLIGGAGAMAGGAAGGLIGSFMGPLGQALGPVVGALLGKGAEMLFGLFEKKSEIQKARDELNKVIELETQKREGLETMLAAATMRQKADDDLRSSRNKILGAMEETAAKQKDKAIVLNELEAVMLQQRAKELTMFGKSSKEARELLNNLGTGTKLTKQQLDMLIGGAKAYEEELGRLRSATQAQADLEMAKLQGSRLGVEKSSLEATTKLREAEIKAAKAELASKGGAFMGDNAMARSVLGGDAAKILETAQRGGIKLNKKQMEQLEVEARINRMETDLMKEQTKLVKVQSDFARESYAIQLRTAVMGSSAFMDFSNSAAMAGRSLDDRFRAFLETPEARAMAGGQMGLDLLRGGSDISSIVQGAKANATRPTVTPVTPLGNPFVTPTNFTGPGSSRTTAVTSTAQVTLDGRKVGEALVTTHLRQ
jgi:hypothetical protein